MQPFLNGQANGMLMYDNAPAHRSKVARDFLEDSGILVLSWPSVSPAQSDENVRALLKSGLGDKTVDGGSNELFEVLEEIWNSIDPLPFILFM